MEIRDGLQALADLRAVNTTHGVGLSDTCSHCGSPGLCAVAVGAV